MNLRIHANNNNNNNYNHHHLPGSPGGDCRSCSVPASFSPRHAVSHQAFSIYNINPHKKVQRAALANRVVGANQLNSLPSHSHICTHTPNPFPNSRYSPACSHVLSSPSHIFVRASLSSRSTRHAHTRSHPFSQPFTHLFSMYRMVDI